MPRWRLKHLQYVLLLDRTASCIALVVLPTRGADIGMHDDFGQGMSAAVASVEIMAIRFEEAQFVFSEEERVMSAINVCKDNLYKCVFVFRAKSHAVLFIVRVAGVPCIVVGVLNSWSTRTRRHGFPVFEESFRHQLLSSSQKKDQEHEAAAACAQPESSSSSSGGGGGGGGSSKRKAASAFDLGTGATHTVRFSPQLRSGDRVSFVDPPSSSVLVPDLVFPHPGCARPWPADVRPRVSPAGFTEVPGAQDQVCGRGCHAGAVLVPVASCTLGNRRRLLAHATTRLPTFVRCRLQMTSMCIATFSVDSPEATSLQLSAAEVIRSIFSAYRAHRIPIANDVAVFVSRTALPTKVPRRFLSIHPPVEIQVSTALLLQLVQSCSQQRDGQVGLHPSLRCLVDAINA
jgi:hypothetical protein